jgi:hypothetical protein
MVLDAPRAVRERLSALMVFGPRGHLRPHGGWTSLVSRSQPCATKVRPAREGITPEMAGHRIYRTSVASVYPHYVTKAERKGRTKAEVDEILRWLTGYGESELDAQLEQGANFEQFFAEAPALNPSRKLITGVVCGVRVEEIEDPLMREIRYLDKLVDELARGKSMEKILRTP